MNGEYALVMALFFYLGLFCGVTATMMRGRKR